MDGKIAWIVIVAIAAGCQSAAHDPAAPRARQETYLAKADADGVHGFNRRTGQSVAFIDFRPQGRGFLNDIALGPDGALYVTDTGRRRPRVFRLSGRAVTVAIEDSALGPANGIAWDPAGHARRVGVPPATGAVARGEGSRCSHYPRTFAGWSTPTSRWRR